MLNRRHFTLVAVIALLLSLCSPLAAGDTTATPVASRSSSLAAIAASPTLRLIGYSITEDAGSPAAARVRIHNGTDASGPELFDIQLSASQSARFWPGLTGPPCPNGIYVERVSGTFRMTLYTADH